FAGPRLQTGGILDGGCDRGRMRLSDAPRPPGQHPSHGTRGLSLRLLRPAGGAFVPARYRASGPHAAAWVTPLWLDVCAAHSMQRIKKQRTATARHNSQSTFEGEAHLPELRNNAGAHPDQVRYTVSPTSVSFRRKRP